MFYKNYFVDFEAKCSSELCIFIVDLTEASFSFPYILTLHVQ